MRIPKAEAVLAGYDQITGIQRSLGGQIVNPTALDQAPVSLRKVAQSVTESPGHPCAVALFVAADLTFSYQHAVRALGSQDEMVGKLRTRMHKALSDAVTEYHALMERWWGQFTLAQQNGQGPEWIEEPQGE